MTETMTLKPPVPVFDFLSAEYETEWLADVFVQPTLSKPITNDRSVIVSGERGVGKSALAHWLTRQAMGRDRHTLIARWTPQYREIEVGGYGAMQEQLKQILQACSLSLINYIHEIPDRFTDAPQWVQDAFHWFIYQFTTTRAHILLGRLKASGVKVGYGTIEHLLTSEPPNISNGDMAESEILELFVFSLRQIDIQGVWITVDGLEPWLDIDAKMLAKSLDILLATLGLFEIQGFSFKIFAPQAIVPLILRSNSVQTRRLDPVRLAWSFNELIEIVDNRLRIITDDPEMTISTLVVHERLTAHIERYGGGLPRGWLEAVRPYVDYYLQKNSKASLSQDEFSAIFENHPPRLRISSRTQDVYLGYHRIEPLSPQLATILSYLYEQHNNFCSREELYYCALSGYEQIPKEDEEGYKQLEIWKSGIENIVYQLRKHVEPIPGKQIYLETRRNRGYRLNHTS